MSGWSTLQQAALCTVELSCLRKVPFPPASCVMWPSPPLPLEILGIILDNRTGVRRDRSI